MTLTFAEGDWIVVKFDGSAAFNLEIDRIGEFYEPGISMTVFDLDEGTCTDYQQERGEMFYAEVV